MTKSNREYVVQTMSPVSKSAFQEDGGKLVGKSGLACLYGVEIDRRWFMMELEAKCFEKSLGEPSKILILDQHFSDRPIGKASKFDDGKKELRMDFLLNPAVQAGAEVISNIDNGILTGLSVGFDIVRVETEKRGGEGAKGYEVDIVKEAKLSEVSVVTWPAIDGARIEYNKSNEQNSAVTFAVVDDVDKQPQHRLSAGDRITLATFASIESAMPVNRIRPNPPVENELKDVKSDDKPDTEPDAELEKEPESKADPEPQVIELTEDEKYPGAREVLERILGGKK